MKHREARESAPRQYWARSVSALEQELSTAGSGLTSSEAEKRLQRFGPNRVEANGAPSRLALLWRQFRSPLLLLLVFAAALSLVVGEWSDAVVVSAIICATVTVGFSRESHAQRAIAALEARITIRTRVLRDGTVEERPIHEIVPGDIVLLAAGSIVPADGVVLDATDCYVSEAALTGESFPVVKHPGETAADAPLARRSNCLFQGTNVRSGTATCLVVTTGDSTEFGAIAHRLLLRPPETEFDRGILRFGYLLTSAMVVMVVAVLIAHVIRGRPPVETLLFAIALAVGLSPELLPAILTVNLARAAESMAHRGVLVRHLSAIENLGSMDVLCTDKTGTLTEGVVRLEGAYDAEGASSEQVLELSVINASLQAGLPSPLDDAILADHPQPRSQVEKIAEIPFDFVRKRVSVVIQDSTGVRLVMKGAFHQVLDVCGRTADGRVLDKKVRSALERQYDAWSAEGIRVLAIAEKEVSRQSSHGRADEIDLSFAGFLTFLDRPKEGVSDAITALAAAGVSLKLITGDSGLVARHVARLVGLPSDRILTGRQLNELHGEALWHAAERTDLFVEVDPNQKEHILLALKKTGHVVGFLGDGVNDAPAMHAADASLSVDDAVDVARAAADFVLLERGLDVIQRGIEEGRKTFANTLKYILTTTSANLGNMVSMAAASLFLPFLPLLAGQILLNNFISDVPAVGIAADSVDPELVDRPRRWDMAFITRFMVEFGFLSSAFDLLTFVVLMWAVHASPEAFRTGWFVESLLTELVIALVVRTRRRFFRSMPGRLLLISTLVLIALTFAIPFLPGAHILGFVPLPPSLLLAIAAITAAYVAAAETLKAWFYRTADDERSGGYASSVRRPSGAR